MPGTSWGFGVKTQFYGSTILKFEILHLSTDHILVDIFLLNWVKLTNTEN